MTEPVRLSRALRVALILMAGTVALAACSESDASVDWAGTVTDSAGVAIVQNPATGLWADHEPWTLREELRIGESGGDRGYEFAQIGSIAVTSTGHIVVVDRQLMVLRVFDAEGRFVREIGSAGEAPGEFGRGMVDVFVGPGDTLIVPDVRNRRVQRFTLEGEYLDSSPIDVASYRALRFRWNPGTGTGVGQLRPIGERAAGDPRDELRPVLADGSMGPPLLTLPAGGLLGPGGSLRYFTPEPVWEVSDSLTVLYAINSAYRIQRYDRQGNLRRVITMPHENRPITERDIRAFFVYLDQAWLGNGVPPSRLPQNRSRVSFAEFFPAFYQFHLGPGGTLWVQPVRPPGELSDEELERYNFIEDFGASDWDVFDPDGRFLGEVLMPPRFQPRTFAGDAIYGVARDDMDVQYVVRLRIEGNG